MFNGLNTLNIALHSGKHVVCCREEFCPDWCNYVASEYYSTITSQVLMNPPGEQAVCCVPVLPEKSTLFGERTAKVDHHFRFECHLHVYDIWTLQVRFIYLLQHHVNHVWRSHVEEPQTIKVSGRPFAGRASAAAYSMQYKHPVLVQTNTVATLTLETREHILFLCTNSISKEVL